MDTSTEFVQSIVPIVAAILSGAIALYTQRKPKPEQAIERIKTREMPAPVLDMLKDNTARIVVLERQAEVLAVRMSNVENGQDRMEKKIDTILLFLVEKGNSKT